MSTPQSKLLTLKPLNLKGKEIPRYALQDVWFYFLNTMPMLGKGKEADASFPMKNRSYSVSVLADRKTAVAFKKKFSDCKIETVDAEEFEEKFKCEPPFKAETYSLIKMNRHASYPDGTFFLGTHGLDIFILEGRRPVSVSMKRLKAKPNPEHLDGKDYDGIIPNINVGNGSKGTILCEEYAYTFEKVTKTKPIHRAVYISELVEYKGSDSVDRSLDENELSELGFEEPVESSEIIEEQAQDNDIDEGVDDSSSDDDDDKIPDYDDDDDDDDKIPDYDDDDDDDDVPFKTE